MTAKETLELLEDLDTRTALRWSASFTVELPEVAEGRQPSRLVELRGASKHGDHVHMERVNDLWLCTAIFDGERYASSHATPHGALDLAIGAVERKRDRLADFIERLTGA